MCDPYPCWSPGISEGPAGYKGKGRTKYTFHPNVFDFFPKFYRGDPPKTNRSKSNPFENFYCIGLPLEYRNTRRARATRARR